MENRQSISASSQLQKQRREKVGSLLLSIFGIDALYVLYVSFSGKGIPCLFRALTGKLCPGCGMTHALMALLKGEPIRAFQYNALSVTLLPVLGICLCYKCGRYIRDGSEEFGGWETAFLVIALAVCLGYGMMRNM